MEDDDELETWLWGNHPLFREIVLKCIDELKPSKNFRDWREVLEEIAQKSSEQESSKDKQ